MAIEIFNRYENKYLMDTNTFHRVVSVLEQHMTADTHNPKRVDPKTGASAYDYYTISNIYYDTADDFLIRNSLAKPLYKEKLRLRGYGVPHPGDTVFLEIKKKYEGLVNKRRTCLITGEAYRMLAKGRKPAVKPYMNTQVLDEISCLLKRYSLIPKVYIAYDRLAFFEKDNDDLRISFDKNIRTRRYDLRLELGDYGAPLLDRHLRLMEIKTSRAMPIWLTDLLTENKLYKSNFSKYGTEYIQFLHDGNILHEETQTIGRRKIS